MYVKLIYCQKCRDIINMIDAPRRCGCGSCGGWYEEDHRKIVIFGPCIPLGILRESLEGAIFSRPTRGPGRELFAFVIPRKCDSVKHLRDDPAAHKPEDEIPE